MHFRIHYRNVGNTSRKWAFESSVFAHLLKVNGEVQRVLPHFVHTLPLLVRRHKQTAVGTWDYRKIPAEITETSPTCR